MSEDNVWSTCQDSESGSEEEARRLNLPDDLEAHDLTAADRWCLKHAKGWVFSLLFVLVFVQAFVVFGSPSHNKGGFNNYRLGKVDMNHPSQDVTAGEKLGAASITTLIGIGRQQKLQSSILVVVAFSLIGAGTLTATFIASLDQKNLPKDFRQKGTISNVTQEVSKPEGRLWTTSLGFGSVMMIISMYTFWIYRSWAPWVDLNLNPLVQPFYQPVAERRLRAAWGTIPYVGFILTAMLPSLSDIEGYNIVLTGVHNVCAPLSMLFCMVMETVQLGFGEHAFEYFWSHEPTPLYGPLTPFQRWRAIACLEAWTAGIIFVSVQGFLAFVPNRRYWLALVSFYGEVIGLSLAFMLPAISGMEILAFGDMQSVIEEGKVTSYVVAVNVTA
eukprot:TRINITY_DN2332_c0_g1_i2.p1 TRINITY_DN2332_c0_g1~~TRINITY_DN2332_c0_g1_i2.p1  ORF type:complete len:387 (-),score=65.09 TRINITY_DN2332_c0_g1_i2:73-1233(-)